MDEIYVEAIQMKALLHDFYMGLPLKTEHENLWSHHLRETSLALLLHTISNLLGFSLTEAGFSFIIVTKFCLNWPLLGESGLIRCSILTLFNPPTHFHISTDNPFQTVNRQLFNCVL